MDWFKMPASAGDDPELQGAGERAAWLWTLARCYITIAGTSGRIPATQLPRFGLPHIKARVQALCKQGLWIEEDGGYLDVRWAEDQDELEALEARRRADRERQRRRRAAGADVPPPAGPSRDRSRDVSRRGSRDSPAAEKRREELPPDPPPSGGRQIAPATRCTRHRARPKSWCAECQMPPIVRPDAPRVTEVLAAAGCDHGASDPRLCAFCRTGTQPPDIDAAGGGA